MTTKELLQIRLEYCLMKQRSKKYRSSFYNYKVKQYKFLLSIYQKGNYEDNLQIAEMSVDTLEEWYKNVFNKHQYDFEILGKNPEDIEELEEIKSRMEINKATLKALKFLMNLEDFYEASQYDLMLAKRWNWYCSQGKI